MKTFAQFEADQRFLRESPEAYLVEILERMRDDPVNPDHLFSRHQALVSLNRIDESLPDLDAVIRLEGETPNLVASRGVLLYRLGRYQEALKDFRRTEAMDPHFWDGYFGPWVLVATCLVELGDVAGALDACAKMREDDWFPGVWGLPRGNKAEVTAEIRRRAERR